MAAPGAASFPNTHELPTLVMLTPPSGTFSHWGTNQSCCPSAMPVLSPDPNKTRPHAHCSPATQGLCRLHSAPALAMARQARP